MRIYKPMQLTGYTVRGKDLRTGVAFDDFIVLDKETMRGVEAIGMNVINAVSGLTLQKDMLWIQSQKHIPALLNWICFTCLQGSS